MEPKILNVQEHKPHLTFLPQRTKTFVKQLDVQTANLQNRRHKEWRVRFNSLGFVLY